LVLSLIGAAGLASGAIVQSIAVMRSRRRTKATTKAEGAELYSRESVFLI
jgi:hypothetical protein